MAARHGTCTYLIINVIDLGRVDENCDTASVFHGMSPLLIDGTRKTISLARWLEDMEIIFRVCHIESAPSSSASHAAKGFRIQCYYGGRDNSIYGISSGPEHDYLPAPIDDAGIPEPLFERGYV
ncbi:hypothetical protein TIFTF001_037251 [Ficus carica]|uniref:Uncharacterized protein n=1 Tax=Ficus carica TaxID=3494 RepID=A0AA88JBX6_FICCA|nr:hypothetical protein TIFTF001_037251 [Ficus carica]